MYSFFEIDEHVSFLHNKQIIMTINQKTLNIQTKKDDDDFNELKTQ